jgi:hypothetical protein
MNPLVTGWAYQKVHCPPCDTTLRAGESPQDTKPRPEPTAWMAICPRYLFKYALTRVPTVMGPRGQSSASLRTTTYRTLRVYQFPRNSEDAYSRADSRGKEVLHLATRQGDVLCARERMDEATTPPVTQPLGLMAAV